MNEMAVFFRIKEILLIDDEVFQKLQVQLTKRCYKNVFDVSFDKLEWKNVLFFWSKIWEISNQDNKIDKIMK